VFFWLFFDFFLVVEKYLNQKKERYSPILPLKQG